MSYTYDVVSTIEYHRNLTNTAYRSLIYRWQWCTTSLSPFIFSLYFKRLVEIISKLSFLVHLSSSSSSFSYFFSLVSRSLIHRMVKIFIWTMTHDIKEKPIICVILFLLKTEIQEAWHNLLEWVEHNNVSPIIFDIFF